MEKRLTRVSPVQLGIVLAVFHGLFSLIVFVPMGFFFGFLAAVNPTLHAPASQGVFGMVFGGFMMILMPILNAVLGFIGGVIAAVVYNFVAKITGGVEFTFQDAPEQ